MCHRHISSFDISPRAFSRVNPDTGRARATQLSIRSVNSLLRTRGRYVMAGIHLIKFLPLSRAPAARFKIPREEEHGRSREHNHLDIFPRGAILHPMATQLLLLIPGMTPKCRSFFLYLPLRLFGIFLKPV